MKKTEVGKINQRVIDLLELSVEPETPIFLGQTNVDHMKKEHPEDFKKYFTELENIVATPNYVAKHPRDGSVQYIKKFSEHALVAVRATKSGVMFARSLYEITEEKLEQYRKKGTLKDY